MESEASPVRRWREERGFTLSALAQQIDVKASHLSMFECGKRGLSTKKLARLREVTGLPWRELAPELAEVLGDDLIEAAE